MKNISKGLMITAQLYLEYMYLAFIGRTWGGSIAKRWFDSNYWIENGMKLKWKIDVEWLKIESSMWANESGILLIDERIDSDTRADINGRFALYTSVLELSYGKLQYEKSGLMEAGETFVKIGWITIISMAMLITALMVGDLVFATCFAALSVYGVGLSLLKMRSVLSHLCVIDKTILSSVALAEEIIEEVFPEVMQSVAVKKEVATLQEESEVVLVKGMAVAL